MSCIGMFLTVAIPLGISLAAGAVVIPTAAPASAANVDKALLSVSFEFFAFPGYTAIESTTNCLANIATLRGAPPAVRIGGTTQDRATYNPNLSTAVNYTVANAGDAPDTLTYGPSFFTLAAQMKGDVTVGLNRRLNNQANTLAAALQAKQVMPNLLSIELGNEPEFYASGSPIIPAGGWNPAADGASQKAWFTSLAPSLGNIFQAAVYLQIPTWSTAGLVPMLGSAVNFVKTFSGHSYPQSACGGASTNLQSLLSHSSIVSYTSRFRSEANAAHNAGKRYFLGETNSATCGGGGISPTFGAALWIVDYALQAAINGIERQYFHQGTIGNCQYCWWGRFTVGAPFYGVAFVSEFLGTDGTKLAMLDDGSGAVAVYAIFDSVGRPVRLLVYNSNFFDGSGTRSSTVVSFTGGNLPTSGSRTLKRLTAPSAMSRVDQGEAVTIGGGGTFDSTCRNAGTQTRETISISNSGLSVTVRASESVIVYL
ncbi:Beta-glucuronidase C-terminal domain-containing protein [Pleurotus pulmonarius]